MRWKWTIQWVDKRDSLKTVIVLIAVLANIYIKRRKKQFKIGNHSLWEGLYIIVSVFYAKIDNVELKMKKKKNR